MLDDSMPNSVAGLRPGILFFRGALALAFCLVAPRLTLFALTFSVATYLAADGMASLFLQPHRGRNARSWRWSMLSGAAGIVASAFVLFFPAATTLALGIFTGTWVLALGVFQLLASVDAADGSARRSFLFPGAVCLGLGLVILAQPWIGVVALVALLAASAVSVGVASLALGFHLRRAGPAAPKAEDHPHQPGEEPRRAA